MSKTYTDNPPPYSPITQLHVPQQIITRTIVPVGPDPVIITCPSCHAHIQTRVDHRNSTKTHLMAVILLLLFWPCACVPYCVDSCQNANHFCPNCNAYIGTYNH